MLGSSIKLPRPPKKHMASIHRCHITSYFIFIFLTNGELNKAALAHFDLTLSVQPSKVVRLRMILHLQLQFIHHVGRHNILKTSTINDNITNFSMRSASRMEDVMT